MVAVKLDATQVMGAYSQVLRGMANLTGFDQRAILRAEAGSILKTWAGRVKVASPNWAERREKRKIIRKLGYTQARVRGGVTVNAGWRSAPYGRTWIRVREGGGKGKFLLALGPNFTAPAGTGVFNKYRAKQSATTQRWIADINEAASVVPADVARGVPLARNAVGLARQSVVQIADSLGIDLLRVAGGGVSSAGLIKARSAMASNGRAYHNGQGINGGDSIKPYILLLDSLPYGRRAKIDTALLSVINGRVKYFHESYTRSVFLTQKRIASAYPNLFRVSLSA